MGKWYKSFDGTSSDQNILHLKVEPKPFMSWEADYFWQQITKKSNVFSPYNDTCNENKILVT